MHIQEAQTQALEKTLFDYFGHTSFRTGQLEIISSIVFDLLPEKENHYVTKFHHSI